MAHLFVILLNVWLNSMSCLKPLLAVDSSLDYYTGKVRVLKDGKHIVKILHPGVGDIKEYRDRYGKQLMMLPCGKCIACAEDYARTWQARIMCEASYHDKNCFVTLTYAKNPPENPSKDDLRTFIKAVRNKFGKGIKFFGSGEKGELNKRSHYHIILFGVDFSEDAEPWQKRGQNVLKTSHILADLWKFGFSSLGTLDISSAGYVSKYCDKKKITGLDSGEFVIMSRGLGRQYFIDHYKEIFDSDYLYFDGEKFKIPRYFLKLALKEGDFYYRCFVDDYQDRKRLTATNFRYNHNRSIGSEENALFDIAAMKISDKQHKEVVRDV